MSVADKIIEMGFEDIIIFENPSYETAFLGVTNSNQAIYDYEKMVEYLIETENMTYEDAADFISYNSSYYYGDNYPVILYSCED